MYNKYVILVAVTSSIFLLAGINYIFSKRQIKNLGKVKIIDFYKEAGTSSTFFARIKNESDKDIKPKIIINFFNNTEKDKIEFAEIEPIKAGEVKDVDFNLRAKWGLVNLNKIDFEVMEGEQTLAKTSRLFVVNQTERFKQSWLLLTAVTFGVGIFIIGRVV